MHIEKYNRSAVGHILRHNEPSRARLERDNVCAEKTKQNYSFVGGHGMQNLKKVLCNKKVYANPRKDVNVLCSVCLTAPLDLPADREKEFFSYAFKFLKERYKGPCVSAWVHLDEEPKTKQSTELLEQSKQSGRHHLHYDFVPLVWDEKRQRFKVDAKTVINKKDLQTLHTDFDSYIKKNMNLSLSILNGATVGGNKTILELKEQSLSKDVKRLQKLKNQVQSAIEQVISR